MACMQKSLYRKERARKRDLDKLSLDMIQCEKDGFGCHYGKWKALQDRPVVVEKKENEIPEGWKACPQCGKHFKPNKYGKRQIYCEVECQKKAQKERDKEKIRAHYREYMAKRRAERKNSYA